ncbi:Rv3654c family TadE-like protein [Micromonospora sp. DT81.3]|uniref:Rv3654c family TadE-like protein n=1 Tax=Actinomycetes TaxID=1760 RepID=UPI003CFB615F
MAGAVVTVGALACLACFTLGLAVVGGATVAGQRAAGTADAAALAAADAASGAVLGEPCTRAAHVAAANGARVTACEVEGLVATVTVEDTYAGMAVRASARAAPPPTL